MDLVKAEDVKAQVLGFNTLPVLRQLGLMIGLGLSVALGVMVAIWSQTPNYSLLYGGLSPKDFTQVTQSLDDAGIEYRIDRSGGAILVPASKVHQARMQLASQGLPRGDEVGYELLEKDQGFGSSSFLQKVRYNRALEGELARSISKLSLVQSARVHLAIPKQSAFARKVSKPAVSVVLDLYPGRTLDEMQVAGIVNMVASSVPGLDEEQVTVIDQKGRLLNNAGSSKDMLLSNTQFDYTRRVEDRYVKRILDIVGPIVGADGVRAQVVAEMDFTAQEQTSESFDPQQKVIRSEQLYKSKGDSPASALGIPGALSNQPPVTDGAGEGLPDGATEGSGPGNKRSTERTVRNYELDRTISHTRQSPAMLKRISVAVVVDYRSSLNDKGKIERGALDEKEMEYITSLVKDAVGFSEARNDSVNVVNTPFQLPEEIEPLAEPPIWEEPWVLDLSRQILGGLAVLILAFGILRPTLQRLAIQGKTDAEQTLLPVNAGGQLPAPQGQMTLPNQGANNQQQLLDLASTVAKEDPKRVAQVLNTWVANDG